MQSNNNVTAMGSWVWKTVCTKGFCKRAVWVVTVQSLHTRFKLPSWKGRHLLQKNTSSNHFSQHQEKTLILPCYQSSAWLRSLIWPTPINAFPWIWNASKSTITAGPILKRHPIHGSAWETWSCLTQWLEQARTSSQLVPALAAPPQV